MTKHVHVAARPRSRPSGQAAARLVGSRIDRSCGRSPEEWKELWAGYEEWLDEREREIN